MKYCDIHTHLLPCMDDGSKSVQESITLINRLKVYGVDAIAFTPHYYSNRESVERFIERRDKAAADSIHQFPKDVIYTLGAEVFVTDLLFSADDISPLCYSNTNYMLTELSYDITVKRACDLVERLRSNYGVIPVIAHVERYPEVLSLKGVSALVNAGALVQTNIDSLLCGYFQRKKLIKILDSGLISFLGTDTHSLKKRCPDFAECSRKIINYCGKDFYTNCMQMAQRLFVNKGDIL
ncbi:MAG: hypothetical protein K6F76_01750 [Clostridiales bacterium]|nr:hypothetical protein [Clostridiales bacterium]